MLYSKALCEYYKLDSDFINLGFIMKHVFSILKRICTNTCNTNNSTCITVTATTARTT